MGLGKTLQVIARLLTEREEAADRPPTLISAPTSVLSNWRKEIERFAPQLRTLVHQGSARNKDERSFAAACQAHDVVLTSFALVRPDATRVAGYHAWQALGRQVRHGERGIRILAPYRRVLAEGDEQGAAADRDALVTGFGVATVFDLAQTEGTPLADAPAPHLLAGASDAGTWLWDRLAAFLAAEGVALAREETERANGYYAPAERRVAVHPRLDGDQATKTLAHECAHHVAGARAGVNTMDAETIAESAAFVALAHYGIDAGGYTFPYVARWAGDRATLTRNLEAIRATAYTLIHVATGGTGAALDAAA